MSDLHGRITAALLREDQLRVCKLSDADIKFMADAVIRELDLTQQYLVDGIISDGEPRPWELPCETRYATEWEPFHG